MSVRGVGRRAGGVSIVAVLVATSVLVLGVGLAWADTVAMLVQTVDSGAWSPASNDPSGAAYISGAGYLFVVDTNRNQPDSNGWMMDIHTGDAVSRATGVDEPTGIEYDPVNNTLFISSDAGSGSFIEVITDFDTPQEQRVQVAEDLGSGDTEDPAYDRVSGNLYFVDGGAPPSSASTRGRTTPLATVTTWLRSTSTSPGSIRGSTGRRWTGTRGPGTCSSGAGSARRSTRSPTPAPIWSW